MHDIDDPSGQDRNLGSNDSLMSLVTPSELPRVGGIELGVCGGDSWTSELNHFYTWSETPFGLVSVVGNIDCSPRSSKYLVPFISGSIGVASKSVTEPDPLQILQAVNDYLSERQTILCSANIAMAIWDVDSQLMVIASAGTAGVLWVQDGLTSVHDSEEGAVGKGFDLCGIPEVIEPGVSDCLVLTSGGHMELPGKLKTEWKSLSALEIANRIEDIGTIRVPSVQARLHALVLKKVITL